MEHNVLTDADVRKGWIGWRALTDRIRWVGEWLERQIVGWRSTSDGAAQHGAREC